MAEHYEAGARLYDLRRYPEAAREYRLHLASFPRDAGALAMLAFCLKEEGHLDQAIDAARQAVSHAPDYAYVHYALASVFLRAHRFDDASQAIQEAVRIAPDNADYLGLRSRLEVIARRYDVALQSALAGLEIDPRDRNCLRMQVEALKGLEQSQAAEQALRRAIAIHPADADLHALQGELFLAAGQVQEAGAAYREALRLDPQLDSARRGLAEVLQRRNWLYRAFRAYVDRTAALKPRQRLLLSLAMLAVILACLWPAASSSDGPWWRNVATQFAVLATVLFWSAPALFNLGLSFDRLGHYTLSVGETDAARRVGCLLIPFLILWGASWLMPEPYGECLVLESWCASALVYPAVRLHRCQEGWPRTTLKAYFALLAIAAVTCGSIVVYLTLRRANLERLGEIEAADNARTMAVFVAMPLLASSLVSMVLSNRLTRVRLPRSRK